MLDRIRASLGLARGQASVPEDLSSWPDLGAVLAPIPAGELISRFQTELTSVGATAHRTASRSDIAGLLNLILTNREGGVVLSRNPLLEQLGLPEILRELSVPFWKWPADQGFEAKPDLTSDYRGHCFSAAVGITGVDFALVESGTFVLTSASEGNQLSSLAPPIHIAFYRPSQVVATLEEVLARLPAPAGCGSPDSGRAVIFITGTSRTADIEQILIRGVHGPKELHAVLVQD